jgi:hypothetical protein
MSFSIFLPTVILIGIPIKSISLNLTPARSSRSSNKQSIFIEFNFSYNSLDILDCFSSLLLIKTIATLNGAIFIGLLLGKYFFSQYEGEIEQVFQSDEKIYILQQGVYSSQENVKKYVTKLDYYITHHDGDYYRVYAAITHNKDNVSRLEEYFVSKGNDIYVRELTTNDMEFLELLKQYDLLLESSNGDNELLQIEKQVLSKYEELVLKDE